ncbi:hypothetical protein TIFTF001_001370 [Ficus carica]|uniref:Uncharacterized protein n=1 Tax=Ficus carica TaxID=3494 RepID=A0AA87Z6X7_FICCA|nr:hypothetical protein TIFTF001_001370 [Ficus carica]
MEIHISTGTKVREWTKDKPALDFLKPPLPFKEASCLPLLRPPANSILTPLRKIAQRSEKRRRCERKRNGEKVRESARKSEKGKQRRIPNFPRTQVRWWWSWGSRAARVTLAYIYSDSYTALIHGC